MVQPSDPKTCSVEVVVEESVPFQGQQGIQISRRRGIANLPGKQRHPIRSDPNSRGLIASRGFPIGLLVEALADVIGHQLPECAALVESTLASRFHEHVGEIDGGFHHTAHLANQFTGFLGISWPSQAGLQTTDNLQPTGIQPWAPRGC
jgi:hypothetical protein